MVLSSYYILNNRYKVAIIISFILTVALIVGVSSIEVKNSIDKKEPVKITLTTIIEVPKPAKAIPKQEPQRKEAVEQQKAPVKKEKQIVKTDPVPVKQKPQPVETEEIPVVEKTEAANVSAEPVVKEQELNEYIEIDDLPGAPVIVEPKYPKAAIKWGKEGIVEVEILVGELGKIQEVVLLKSSGHKILDNECVKTIKRKWKLPEMGREYKVFKRFVFQLK